MLSNDTHMPVQLWILSGLDYFKYNIHENWEKKKKKKKKNQTSINKKYKKMAYTTHVSIQMTGII